MRALRWPATLLLGVALAVGLVACGGADEATVDVVPKSTPALTAPEDTSLPEVDTSTLTTTTSTSTTATTTTPATATGGTGATSGTGGTATTGGTGTSTTTTTSGAASGGFSDFCSQNPGACNGN